MYCLPISFWSDKTQNRSYFTHDAEMRLKNSTKLFASCTLLIYLFILQPEAVYEYKADCPVVYSADSDPQYAPESTEIHALAFAIRALAGCAQSKATDPFLAHKVHVSTVIHNMPSFNTRFIIKWGYKDLNRRPQWDDSIPIFYQKRIL